MYMADLHIHSRFSRATSRDCDVPHLDLWARRKGIGMIGTGDFTHPAWRKELREQLVEADRGVYTLRNELILPGIGSENSPRFVVSGEISSIYKKDGKTRKVHNLILLPSLEAADELAARLEAIGNIRSDGRPILGLDSRDLLELTMDICPEAEFIPAHIWTPHFSMFGAFSGFCTVDECFGDMAEYIHAVETGLSSDPPMNWRVSALNGLTLISNSDAHSPAKLGREANLLDTELTYTGLTEAIRTGEGFQGTIEFFPEEGKYHLDGHRSCGVCLEPGETVERGGLCPVCGRKLTIGVEHRVEELADNPQGFRPEAAKTFEWLAPLPEAIAASTGETAAAKKTMECYEKLLKALGTEFYILRQAPVDDIKEVAGPCVAEGIRRLRLGQVVRRAGFDGEYGTISLLTPSEIEQFYGQTSLFAVETSIMEPVIRNTKRKANAAKKETAAAEKKELLNSEQRAAAEAEEGVISVIAGPGTGKTKTLVSRIAFLVEEKGVKAEEITAVTFTNQAAAEMCRRLEKRLGGKKAVSRMSIGTFHAICLKLLGEVKLIDRADALALASEVLSADGRKYDPKDFIREVSRVKNGLSPEESAIDAELLEVYCKKLGGLGLYDFDDLLTEGLKIDTAGQKCFKYLLVDEFQDINNTQYELVKKWSRGSGLFVIGDPDQSIYGFRGANGRCFERLKTDFPETREIRLIENYRSTPKILQASLSVINKNNGEDRKLSANKNSGAKVRLVQTSDEFSEGVFIAKEIGRIAGGIDMLEADRLGKDRTVRPFSDIAVLCRTNRQLELIEKCLQHDDIPCVVNGREDFLDTDEVRGTLAFFFSLAFVDPFSLETALRLVWKCPEDLILKITSAYSRLKVFEPEALKETVKGYSILEAWLARAEEWYPLISKEKPWRLIERWEELYGKTNGLERLKNTAVFYSGLKELRNTLILGQEADFCRAAGKGWESGAVRLMTLHGSKGLEYPAVILAGVREGILPLKAYAGASDPEEERRLFYVGMTRAKEELIITACPELSPFLNELPVSVRRENDNRRMQLQAQQLSLF